MAFMKLSISPDTTFLNSLLFEGLLFIMRKGENKIKFEDLNRISIANDTLVEIYSKLDDNVLNNLSINTVGKNDRPFWQNLFNSFNIIIKEDDKITSYNHILNKLKSNSKNLIISRDSEIGYNISGKNFIIDKGEITAPQLFKVERYTGITSLESDLSSEQITVRCSREVLLIALLGLYSSFIITTRILNKTSYYFLF
jgi:hypothetical protein